MKRVCRFLSLLVAALLAAVVTVHAAAPRQINYQGYLTNPAGAPLTGSYSMVFSLCTAATGGTCPWSETQSVAVDKGIFNVALGSVTALGLTFDTQYYLDIQVGGEQMTARQPLTSVGYAFSADRAESVAAGSITSTSIVPGSITSTSITNNTITNNNLAAGSFSNITGVGTLDTLTVAGDTHLATTSGAVGVKTTSPRASLEVGGTDGLLVTGTVNSGTVRALGAGVRMHWYPRKGAFRVGNAETSYWDDNGSSATNMALYSVGMGYQVRATGTASNAIGAYNKATADYALSLGSYSLANAIHAIAIGTQVTASGIYSMAFGTGADTNGKDGAMVFGDDSYFQTAHAQCDNSITMRFTGYGGSQGPYAYKFMTDLDETTSPNVYMVKGDSAWRSSCSRDLKENFTPVDGEWLLGRVRDLPITQWNYKTADPSVKYIGPVAEDFWDAFRLGGTDNKGISSIAIEGVNIAGVQALEKRTGEMKKEMAEMKSTIDLLRAEIASLKEQLAGK